MLAITIPTPTTGPVTSAIPTPTLIPFVHSVDITRKTPKTIGTLLSLALMISSHRYVFHHHENIVNQSLRFGGKLNTSLGMEH